MATKANHHFIPQFYLRGFASGVGRQAKVFTFDQKTNSTFTTKVRNIGSRRHFFRVDADGVDPNALEDAMSVVEAEFAIHLREVIEAKAFPTPKHFNSIMNILANISTRNPRLRGIMEDFHINVAEKIMSVCLSSEEIWESQMRQMRDAGYPINDDLTYEDIKRFNDSKEYDIKVDQTRLIQMEFKMLNSVLNCSARRSWCFVSAPDSHQFICSDDPVVLSWIDSKNFHPPGHGLKGTMVLFPLCSSLLLVGAFEDLPKQLDYEPDQIIAANTLIKENSTKQIYAFDGTFTLNLRDIGNVIGEDLPMHFRTP